LTPNINEPLLDKAPNKIRFTNFNEDEDTTCIKELLYLQFRPFMCYVVAPILTIVTAFIFGLCLYWFDSLRVSVFYTKVKTIDEASHMFVEGRQGNKEVLELYSCTGQKAGFDTFLYRFI